MKLKKYLTLAAAAMLLVGCKEDPVLPPIDRFSPNTTIMELKSMFWQNEANYVTTVGQNEDGEDIVIQGRVISSDASGNIYKSMMISDGTAAITIAANAYDMSDVFAMGQWVYVKVTGTQIGGYNNLMQIGGEGTYNGSPSMTFMEEDVYNSHIQGIGVVDLAAVDTIATDLVELNNAKTQGDSALMVWQSQLIRLDGLTFEDAGQEFAPSGNTNRYLRDSSGNRINLRCSSYSDFAKDTIPSGTGSVTAILSYYGNDWQMLLIDLEGLVGFNGGDNAPDAPVTGGGSKDEPFTVDEVIAMGNPGDVAWVKGYIVGVMNYVEGTGNVFSASQLTTNTNIVIAATASDYGSDYVAVQLPQGDLRTSLNLVDHPDLLGKEVEIQGSLSKYCGIAGLKECTAAVVDGKEVGGETPDTPAAGGVNFTLATSVESGAIYALWAESKVGTAFGADKTYGYIQVADCKPADGAISTSADNGFIFTQTDKGWTIQQNSDKRYLLMTGSYNSFNLSSSLDASDNGYYWDITFDATGTSIKNVSTGKTIQYDTQYKSYGSYSDMRGVLPILYKK